MHKSYKIRTYFVILKHEKERIRLSKKLETIKRPQTIDNQRRSSNRKNLVNERIGKGGIQESGLYKL